MALICGQSTPDVSDRWGTRIIKRPSTMEEAAIDRGRAGRSPLKPCRIRRSRRVLAQDINAEMPGYVAGRIAQVLNDRSKAVRGSRVLAIGVTYKPDVGDIRESAAIRVMQALADRGADLAYHEPFHPSGHGRP